MKRFSKFITLPFVALVFFMSAHYANAETVLIEGAGQSKGQGWLFGSPQDASCWVVTPAHVVRAGKTGMVSDFIWRDIDGRQGSGVSAFIPKVGTDLAFAKVIGRAKGDCLSRLGADTLSASIRRQPNVEAIIMQKTHVDPRAMKVRSFNEEFLTFDPSTDQVKAYMKPGISGAPLILRQEDGLDIPLGLITSVKRDQSAGFALRFDIIKALFMSQKPGSKENNEASAEQSFQIVSASGRSAEAGSAVNAVLTDDRCWLARPVEKKRSFDLVVQPLNKDGVSKAVIEFDPSCGSAPTTIIVEHEYKDKWQTFGQCKATPNYANCIFPKLARGNIRFTFIARDGLSRGIKRLSLK